MSFTTVETLEKSRGKWHIFSTSKSKSSTFYLYGLMSTVV